VVSGNSKWCSGITNATLQVDLGAARTIRRFVIRHAAAGGEQQAWNTRGFTIQVSADATAWATLVNVTANTDGVTTHPVNPTTARYVRLVVTTPTQTADSAARVYEFEVDGARPREWYGRRRPPTCRASSRDMSHFPASSTFGAIRSRPVRPAGVYSYCTTGKETGP